MHPIIFRFGPIVIYSYGVWVVIGLISGLALTLRTARQDGIPQEVIFDLAFWLLFFGILGARLLYVMFDLPYFKSRPLEAIQIWKGGFVFYGGVFSSLLASLFYIRRHRLNFWQMADLVAPALALGQGIGRFGCFSAGCCYGRPTHLPWAITFKDPQSLAPIGTPLHPTQLYHALSCFLIFFTLILIKKRKLTAYGQGQLFFLYLMLHSTFRFFIEFFRGDPRPRLSPFLTITQGIALIITIGAFAFYLYRRKASK